MTVWQDRGIVIAKKPHGEKYRLITIFTYEHGKVCSMASNKKREQYSIFSKVEVEHTSNSNESLGFWSLKHEKQSWVIAAESEAQIILCQSICFLINKLMPQGVPHKRIFDLTNHIAEEVNKFTEQEILQLYAYFEITVLCDIGLGIENDLLNIVVKSRDLKHLKETLNTEPLKSDSKKLLSLSGNLISEHLINIDNYFRSIIIQNI